MSKQPTHIILSDDEWRGILNDLNNFWKPSEGRYNKIPSYLQILHEVLKSKYSEF